MTGMRIGEASALHWSDIDCETGLLSITKTLYYRTMTDYKFVEPKTQASIRTIYIDSDTLNELKAWQSVQQQVLPDCPLVLSYNGTPTSKTTLPRALEKLSNLAGVHRIKIHALRHSHASLLISMGENPLLIKERLGHEKIQTTLGTYGHLYPNTNLEVAKKLTGILQVQSATESIANYTSNQHTAIVNAPYQVPYKLKAASAALLHCFFGFLTTSGNFSDHGSRSSKNDRSLSSMCLGISVRRCSKYSYGFRLFAFAVSAML